jgi:16S rRNA (cytosine1402-N4)-methyltransferase
MEPKLHIPVLLKEVIDALNVKKGGRYIDCTVGTGGHASAILDNAMPGGRLLGIDADPYAIATASARLSRFGDAVLLLRHNFAYLEAIASDKNFRPVDGILFDLGLSSLQLDNEVGGFSFQKDSPLDMRFDPDQEMTAEKLVNRASVDELYHIIRRYGEEPLARRIARSIVAHRPITGTLHLVQVIEKVTGAFRGRIHPATKTFQALRIAVNRELENLQTGLRQATNLLTTGGRLVVISYHSLEDRIVKKYFYEESRGCLCPPEVLKCICGHTPVLRLINKKVITPKAEEVLFNPRCRSARLRAAEKL